MAAKKMDILRKVDFVAISIDSMDEMKNDTIKAVPGAWKSAMHSVDVLQKEGIRVAVTPTISQKNLYEIMDLTEYFTGRKIPMWFCLYAYDTSVDSKQLFRIGKANDEFIITDKDAMVNLCNQLIKAMKKNKEILMTKKLLETLRSLYEPEEQRIWKCQALNQFLVIDHLGRVSGCHNHNFTGFVFDLPAQWNSKKFKTLRETYHNCTQCNYLCYIAYSLYGNPQSIISLAGDQWKNIKLLFR
jgi:MoaA/NifB/PqqE/SkfB family radical SAM enzyme